MWTANVITYLVLAAVLVVASVTELRDRKIYNWLTAPAFIVGLVLAVSTGYFLGGGAGVNEAFMNWLFAVLLAFVPMAIFFAAGGFNGGDVKLMTAVGSICAHWACVLDIMIYAIAIGAVMAVVIMFRHRVVIRTLRRIFSAALLWLSRVQPDMPEDSPKVPYGVAIGIGGLVAGAHHLLQMPLPWTTWGPT